MRYYSDVLEKVEKRWVLSHVIVVLVLGTEGEDIWLYVSMCEDVGLKVWRVMWRSLYCWYVYMCTCVCYEIHVQGTSLHTLMYM